jgi:hypothetical protein
MSKLERTKQRIEKLNLKAEQAQEKLNAAKALLEEAQSEEIKSLVFYVGSSFVNALQKGEIDPDYLINLCSAHGDKRKDFSDSIKSIHGKKASEIPASR